MRRTSRHALLLLAAVLSATGVAACGGGGSSVSSTAVSTVAPRVASTTTSSSAVAAAKPAGRAPRRSSPSSGSAAGGSGGGAASFRAPHTDNSIPNFGSEAPASEQQRATAVLAGYLRARAGGEFSRACSYLALATRGELERLAGGANGQSKGCGAILAALSRGPAASRADPLAGGVAALRVRAKSAFALFHGPGNSKYVMPMVSEGGAWKVSQLAPLAYPLGMPAATP
jgi:hypothetical protein